MKFLLSALTFLTRHVLFVLLAVVVGCLCWTLVYFALLLVAVLTDQGLGGPLALPAGLILISMALVIVGWGIFAPASATGLIVTRRFRWPLIAAIPVVWLTALLLFYLFCWACTAWLASPPMPSAVTVLKSYFIYLSVPLGAYWWLTEGPWALFDLFKRWRHAKRVA